MKIINITYNILLVIIFACLLFGIYRIGAIRCGGFSAESPIRSTKFELSTNV